VVHAHDNGRTELRCTDTIKLVVVDRPIGGNGLKGRNDATVVNSNGMPISWVRCKLQRDVGR
jgi:hypothetical protein